VYAWRRAVRVRVRSVVCAVRSVCACACVWCACSARAQRAVMRLRGGGGGGGWGCGELSTAHHCSAYTGLKNRWYHTLPMFMLCVARRSLFTMATCPVGHGDATWLETGGGTFCHVRRFTTTHMKCVRERAEMLIRATQPDHGRHRLRMRAYTWRMSGITRA